MSVNASDFTNLRLDDSRTTLRGVSADTSAGRSVLLVLLLASVALLLLLSAALLLLLSVALLALLGAASVAAKDVEH